jgi:hypothetical protein
MPKRIQIIGNVTPPGKAVAVAGDIAPLRGLRIRLDRAITLIFHRSHEDEKQVSGKIV